MHGKLYNPFNPFNINSKHCFLSGETLATSEDFIPVFPKWIIDEFGLSDQPFKLLNETYTAYGKLNIPCSPFIKDKYLDPLEEEIKATFLKGYKGISKIDEKKIFLWVAKIVYGLIFNEILLGLTIGSYEEEFLISPALIERFTNLHRCLQSIYKNIIFDDFKPWSFFLFKVAEDNQHPFHHRNEINTLTFTLQMKDFAFIMCLQDNESNTNYHKEIYQKIKNEPLHPIQYQEFCARVFYSNYLFNSIPQYDILHVNEEIYLSPVSLTMLNGKPLFDEWQPKVYAQLLEAFWKRWNYSLVEIMKEPHKPLSFLFDEKELFMKDLKI